MIPAWTLAPAFIIGIGVGMGVMYGFARALAKVWKAIGAAARVPPI